MHDLKVRRMSNVVGEDFATPSGIRKLYYALWPYKDYKEVKQELSLVRGVMDASPLTSVGDRNDYK